MTREEQNTEKDTKYIWKKDIIHQDFFHIVIFGDTRFWSKVVVPDLIMILCLSIKHKILGRPKLRT